MKAPELVVAGKAKGLDGDRLLTLAEAAEVFGMSVDQMRSWVATGVMRGGNVRKKGRVFVRESEVRRLLKKIYGDG